jgi:hypothetical protein
MFKLLRPVVNLLIRYDVSHSELAIASYVFAAYDGLLILDWKRTISKLAVLTGLRKDRRRNRRIRLLKCAKTKLSYMTFEPSGNVAKPAMESCASALLGHDGDNPALST